MVTLKASFPEKSRPFASSTLRAALAIRSRTLRGHCGVHSPGCGFSGEPPGSKFGLSSSQATHCLYHQCVVYLCSTAKCSLETFLSTCILVACNQLGINALGVLSSHPWVGPYETQNVVVASCCKIAIALTTLESGGPVGESSATRRLSWRARSRRGSRRSRCELH